MDLLISKPREKRWVTIGCSLLASAAAAFALARIAAGAGWIPESSALDGLDYLPPWWLAGVAVPIALLCWALGRRRAAAAALLPFLVLLAAEGDWSLRSRPQAPKGPELRVLALNVQYYKAGHEKVIAAIKQMAPDVALLSENRLSDADRDAVRAAFQPYAFYSGRSEETAIASKLPVLDIKEVELPSFQASLDGPNRIADQSGHPHRTFLHARVDDGGTPVNLISIRFIAGRPASSSAADQLEWGRYLLAAHHQEVRFFLDYLSKVKGPIVFGGDLNAPPSAMLIRHLDEVAADAYLSTHTFGRPTFRVNLPTLRLDYLFSMNGAVAVEADRPDRLVSDHFPLLAKFALPSP